jgi:hypothetical protein
MTGRAGDVVQVIGRAHAGDPVTATAVALHARLTSLGRRGRLTAAEPGTIGMIERYDRAMDGQLVVHSVDGGGDLDVALGDLADRSLTLVHHGSAIGSDRHALRALRSSTRRAVAADASAREELRGLGFSNVGTLDGDVADDPFVDVVAHQPTVDNLARHPGPLLLCIGPIAPNRGLETLLAAFGEVLTHLQPSAVLSLCGPSAPWYRDRLQRYLTRRGLLACEVIEPADDGGVLARVDRAVTAIFLRPTAFDPYLRATARRGLPVVAPLGAATTGVDPAALVPISSTPTTTELAGALGEALRRPHTSPRPVRASRDGDVLAALGLA